MMYFTGWPKHKITKKARHRTDFEADLLTTDYWLPMNQYLYSQQTASEIFILLRWAINTNTRTLRIQYSFSS